MSKDKKEPLRPFMGLRSFEEKNKSQFGGRDTEISELFHLVEDNGLTVVFGKSGIGKTSLLKAGLVPELKQNYYFPIYLRIDFNSDKKPLQQVREFLFQAMHEKDPEVTPIGNESLWEYLHNVKFLGGFVTPVIMLDQFEEIFTLGEENKGAVLEMLEELSDLAENRIPQEVKETYKSKGKTVPSYYNEQSYRVLFSLREDYLAHLEELKKHMPTLLDNRFRVVQMTIEQALDAAIKPGKGLINEAVAKAIIIKLPGVSQNDFDILEEGGEPNQNLKVEPFLLSLLCDRINEKRIEKDLDTITIELVSEFDVKDVINSFYNDTLAKYDTKVGHAIEDRLLTEGGFRKLQALDEMQSAYDISDEVIDELVEARIVRQEIRDGVDYIELIHDVLAPIIKAKRDKRKEEEREKERIALLAEAKAKVRKRNIGIASVIIPVILVIAYFLYTINNDLNEFKKQSKEIAFAKSLMFSANSTKGRNQYGPAAHLTRVSYQIYKKATNARNSKINKNDSKFLEINILDDQLYYHSLLGALKDIYEFVEPERIKGEKLDFEIFNDNSLSVTTLEALENGKVILAFDNGTVIKHVVKKVEDSKGIKKKEVQLDTIFQVGDFMETESDDKYITSIVNIKKDGDSLLAMAGNFEFLLIYDLKDEKIIKKIPFSINRLTDSSLELTESDRLILVNNKTIMAWDYPYEKNVVWKDKSQKKLVWNEKELKWADSTKSIKRPYFTIKDGTILESSSRIIKLTVYSDTLFAVSTAKRKNSVTLMTNNEFIELEYKNLPKKITAMKFNAMGSNLIVGADDGSVKSLNLSDGNKLNKLTHFHSDKIRDVVYSPKRKRFASASKDGTITIWDAETSFGRRILSLELLGYEIEDYAVNKIEFSQDGTELIAGYDMGIVIKWPLDMNVLVEFICANVRRPLTKKHWDDFIQLDYLEREYFNCKPESK